MPNTEDLITQPTAPIRFKRLRLAIVVLGSFVILAFAASSAYDAWRAYHNSLAANDREIDNVAKALAEQTAWTWQGIDLLLRDTARWYRNDGSKIAPERLDEVLANRTAGVRQLRIITITDAQGIQRHRSRGSSPPNLNVSDRSYFIAQRDGTANGLFMSEPLITRTENRAGIVLSRRLEDDKKEFAGVITAIVDLEDLEQFYGSVSLGQGSAIQLLRDVFSHPQPVQGPLLVWWEGNARSIATSVFYARRPVQQIQLQFRPIDVLTDKYLFQPQTLEDAVAPGPRIILLDKYLVQQIPSDFSYRQIVSGRSMEVGVIARN